VPAGVVLPRWGASSAPSNPLAGFEGPLLGGSEGKREEMERKRIEGKGRAEGTGENTPFPRNKFLVTALL